MVQVGNGNVKIGSYVCGVTVSMAHILVVDGKLEWYNLLQHTFRSKHRFLMLVVEWVERVCIACVKTRRNNIAYKEGIMCDRVKWAGEGGTGVWLLHLYIIVSY